MDHRHQFMDQPLVARRENDRLRTLRVYRPDMEGYLLNDRSAKLFDVSGNDYLGLSKHPAVKEFSIECVNYYGCGSTGSRLITGTTPLHKELEDELAVWLGREAVLVFNSGYQMNVSLIASLSDKNTHLYYDKKNHNSLIQGALLGKGTLHRYKHTDYSHLEELLRRHSSTNGRSIIVTESVFSMDGDVADLRVISEIADRYNALLIVDEAHATGVWGDDGRGFAYGMERVDLVLGTFGKSFGSFGAFVACSAKMKEYLTNFCSGIIYTTALPPSVIGSNLGALRLMPDLNHLRTKVIHNAAWLRRKLVEQGYHISGSVSQIIPVVLGNENDSIRVAEKLEKKGFLATPIRPPTVEQGTSRLRLTVSSALPENALERLPLAISESYEL